MAIILVQSTTFTTTKKDGTNKMSKSAENDNSRINLLDTPDVISKKIKKCKTDLFTGTSINLPIPSPV